MESARQRAWDLELPEDGDAGADFVRAIGKQLRAARQVANYSLESAAAQPGYSSETLSSIERGRRVPQAQLLRRADALFDAKGMLDATVEDLDEAKQKTQKRHPSWFRTYANLERSALEIHGYTTMVVPGLLQTEPHMRALYQMQEPPITEATTEKWVADRLARQQDILYSQASWPPPKNTYVIEEAVLHRPLGGPKVQKEQLENLLRVSMLPRSELQIMPMDLDVHPNLNGPFNLLLLPDRPQVAYYESHGNPQLITDEDNVRLLTARYGSIRAQALGFRESRDLIEKLWGAL